MARAVAESPANHKEYHQFSNSFNHFTMANNPLNLDKERLVRLQEQQMSALTGGAGAADQSTDTDVGVEVPQLPGSGFGGGGTSSLTGDGDRSCCKKSCNGPASVE